MATEIERKFLVSGDGWRGQAVGTAFVQGYIHADKDSSVRVRIEGDQARMTVKSGRGGIRRLEYEYPIPLADAREMLEQVCRKPLIEKTRWKLADGIFVWEIDEFAGDNAGLVIAEIELRDESQEVPRPDWLGREVSDDPRYLNANLVRDPWCNWGNKEQGGR